jgi:hypothetical protein
MKPLSFSLACLALSLPAGAAPYASGVTITGLDVSFTLNEPADTLLYSINGGAFQSLDGSSKGSKLFSLGAPTDTFTIRASKTDSVGYSIPTGSTIANATSGLSQPTAEGGFRLLSDDSSSLVRFNSVRGVAVVTNPAAPNFGNAYISNSAAGNSAGVVRTLGDGLYALKADQSDAFGYGNTAKAGTSNQLIFGASANSPFRITAASTGEIYIADFSDANGQVARASSDLSSFSSVLHNTVTTNSGTFPVPTGQNHGSTTAVHALVTSAGLTVYTLDEDLTTFAATGAGSTTNRNTLWRYDIGTGSTPYSGSATPLASVLISGATSDLDVGTDGKFYLMQNRSAGGEAGLTVLGSDGISLWDSLSASRTLLGNPAATDILRNVQGGAVSLDQKWIALVLNNSDVAVVPMTDGVPDLSNRLLVNTGTDINSGRDIVFDAAGNIHYVSSGQGLYRVLSPGGTTSFDTIWDGSKLSFAPIPEPGAASLAALSALALLRRRRAR